MLLWTIIQHYVGVQRLTVNTLLNVIYLKPHLIQSYLQLCVLVAMICVFGCGLANHQVSKRTILAYTIWTKSLYTMKPALCSMVKKWAHKCKDDSETANWISAHTKECGKCQSTIEKNGGCNHMTCRKCRYEFCWVCMGMYHFEVAYNDLNTN